MICLGSEGDHLRGCSKLCEVSFQGLLLLRFQPFQDCFSAHDAFNRPLRLLLGDHLNDVLFLNVFFLLLDIDLLDIDAHFLIALALMLGHCHLL